MTERLLVYSEDSRGMNQAARISGKESCGLFRPNDFDFICPPGAVFVSVRMRDVLSFKHAAIIT